MSGQPEASPNADKGSVLFSLRVLTILIGALPSLWVVLALTSSAERAHRMVRLWARGIIRLSGCRFRVSGLEHLEQATCAVIVANHSSFLDSVVLLAALPPGYRLVVNHLAATRPLVGLVIRRSGHLVVDRRSARSRAECARAMIASLEAGTSLLLFPEGTRGGDTLLPFQAGAFRTAVRTGRPVVPVAIAGTRRILPRRFRLLQRAPIHVSILPAIRVGANTVEDAARLRDAAASAIAAALATP